ncbi:Respiratory burst oxidase-like protein B [Picochlorum sp. SENEW3]|nr:Respiratory burst oxidase-like protein B [Picochlorum sp. SENEW3]
MEDDYLEKSIEEVLDACCVFNNVVREGIKQKILYDLDNLKTPNASQVADSDLIWSTLDMEADLQIENQSRQKSIDGASISKRMKLYIIRNSLIVFMLCALFCIAVAAAFVLSFPRSQIGVWKEKGRLALLSVAVAGASLAVASLVFCLLSANGLLRYLFYKKLSHHVHLPVTMSTLHRVFGIIVLLGSIVHSIAWFPLYWSISSSEGWVNGDSKYRSLTLHWVVRDIEAARTWFKTLFESMEDLRQSSENCSIRVNIWLTGIKPELVKLAKRVGSVHADVCGLDILSGIRLKSSNTMSHFGRPDFGQILRDYDPGASVAESPVGVFCCGPTSMVASLRHACNTFPAISGKHFAFHAEDFHSY